MEVHIVQKGDTLWKISRQYGISFEELKKVNAHLANPDYIVPGMKISLPNQPQGHKETVKKQKTPVKKVEKVEDLPSIEKKPVKESEIPQKKKKKPEAPKQEKEPIPLPKPPTITKKPIEKEKVKEPMEKSPKEKPKGEHHHTPQYPQQPGTMQQPMMPMQPIPIFGIPCGWMPIYDADCYTHHHHHHRHMHPMPTKPMHQLPVEESSHHHHHKHTHPMPTKPMHQLPVEESSHHQPYRPPVPPIYQENKKKKEEYCPEKGQNIQPRPIMPQLNQPTLSVPNNMPRIESSSIKIPKQKQEEKVPFTPPAYEVPSAQPIQPSQPVPPFEQGSYYPNWPHPGAQSHPPHAGETPYYGMHEYTPIQAAQPMQPHPFCNQCQQPIAPYPTGPMYYPIPHYWRGSY